ncbi:MAG TPA: thermonuclease family protein [Candidatus Omnitrophota bacterium]|nr:thermonuclease family protein [Candidatus Omnitrophota bacterium]HRZ14617.1 thermonuclease family protein [Candidatus Omnitrophota bacterium]
MKKSLWIVLAASAAALLYGCEAGSLETSGAGKTGVPFGQRFSYNDILVTRVVDGDTLKLANGERVRLIGIDTPEVHESYKLHRDSQQSGKDISTIRSLGKRSSVFVKELVENKRVRLEFDVERRDKYGRLLAYVYLQDGTFLNAEIIRQGYASLLTYPPNVKHAEEFRKLYQQARDDKRGLWKD